VTAGTDGPPGGSLGRVVALGAYILDVLGRPVDTIPPGQASVRLEVRTPDATLVGSKKGRINTRAHTFTVGLRRSYPKLVVIARVTDGNGVTARAVRRIKRPKG